MRWCRPRALPPLAARLTHLGGDELQVKGVGGVVVLQGLCGTAAAPAAAVALDVDLCVVNDLTLRGAVGSPGLWPATIRLLESGRLDAAADIVTHELPLADFQAALHLVRTRGAVKVLLRPQDGAGDDDNAGGR